jgi:thiosulfate/3-mercaptopyruvate sulfurtransferase
VANPLPPLVSADWLAEHQNAVTLCDVRWYLDGRSGRAAYLEGHLPGAVWIDLDTVLASPPSAGAGRHPLPSPEAFAAGLGAAGVADDALVVGYDDLGGMAAGRLVWLLRTLGRPAALLDGGLAAWPGPLDSGEAGRAAVERRVSPWPASAFATATETAAAAAGMAAVVIDARAPERYRGEVEPLDARAGHIPGAANAPFAANLAEGHFLPPSELRQRFADLGIDGTTEVIAYCGSGVSACHNLLALEAAGFDPGRARLYPGSWSQWAADPTRPAASG